MPGEHTVVPQMSGAVGVSALQQHGTHGEQSPVGLPPREAERTMDNVVGDGHHGDEEQEDQKGC
jgi:hypothetical protein